MPDNANAPQPVRERLDDMRPIVIAARVAAYAAVPVFLAGAMLGLSSWTLCAVIIAMLPIHEWRARWPATARSVESLDRRLFACVLVTLAWVASVRVVTEAPAWLWLMPYVLVLGAYAPALQPRSLALATAVAIAILTGEVLAVQAGWFTPRPYVEPSWWVWIVRTVIGVPVLLALIAATPLRLRATRAGLQSLATALRRAERELSDSHARLPRWNEELHNAVRVQTTELEQRNRRLSVLNSVTAALAEDVEDERWLERSLTLIAHMLEAGSVACLIDAPGGDGTLVSSTVVVGGASTPIPAWLMEDVVATGLPRYSDPAADPQPGAAGLLSRYAVIPLRARGHSRGALAVAASGDGGWPDSELQILDTVASELAAAIESRELHLATVARARRDAVLADVIELLEGETESAEAIKLAMRRVGDLLGAMLMAVVTPRAGSQPTRVAARVVFEGRGAALLAADAALHAVLMAAPALVSDRVHPLIFGDGGEAPLSPRTAAFGVRSLLVCPLVNPRGTRGALVLLGDGSVRYGAGEREMIERLARMFSHRIASDGLFRLQERRIAELSGLAQIAEVIQSTSDADRLLAGFARGLRQLFPFTDVFFARLDGAAGDGVSVSRYGIGRHPVSQFGMRDEPSAHPWFALRGPTVCDTRHGALPAFCADVEQPMLVVPLRPKGQMLGIVVVAAALPPTPEETALIAQAVGQLGLALDSISLYRQATERAARIQVLGNLARIVASVVDVRDAFTAFAEEVRWLLPFDSAVMVRVYPERGTLESFAAYPEERSLWAGAVPLGDSVMATASESRHILTVRASDPECAGYNWTTVGLELPGGDGDGVASEIALVPILRGDVCTALLVLTHSEQTPYTADEIAALEEVARLLAVSIERVDLFTQTEYSARHDLLTGLPNYRYLQERLREVRAGAGASGSTALLMVDMDDLKLFNDTLGHVAGDEVIQTVARAIRGVCRAEDFVARVGGDEFIAVLEGADTAAAIGIAERLHEALRAARAQIPDAPAAIRVSAGVAALPLDGETVEDLLQAADMAMYEAKFAGGGRTGVASELPVTRHKRGFTGRPDRVVETVIRAVSASASLAERDAVALAQRYAVGAAIRLGVPAHDAEALRMLVARHAAPGLIDARPGLDGMLAARLLDGLATDWLVRAPESAAIGQVVVSAAVDLAWLQLEAPAGAGYALDTALEQMRRSGGGPLSETVRRELEVVARADQASVEAGRRVA